MIDKVFTFADHGDDVDLSVLGIESNHLYRMRDSYVFIPGVSGELGLQPDGSTGMNYLTVMTPPGQLLMVVAAKYKPRTRQFSVAGSLVGIFGTTKDGKINTSESVILPSPAFSGDRRRKDIQEQAQSRFRQWFEWIAERVD